MTLTISGDAIARECRSSDRAVRGPIFVQVKYGLANRKSDFHSEMAIVFPSARV